MRKLNGGLGFKYIGWNLGGNAEKTANLESKDVGEIWGPNTVCPEVNHEVSLAERKLGGVPWFSLFYAVEILFGS